MESYSTWFFVTGFYFTGMFLSFFLLSLLSNIPECGHVTFMYSAVSWWPGLVFLTSHCQRTTLPWLTYNDTWPNLVSVPPTKVLTHPKRRTHNGFWWSATIKSISSHRKFSSFYLCTVIVSSLQSSLLCFYIGRSMACGIKTIVRKKGQQQSKCY